MSAPMSDFYTESYAKFGGDPPFEPVMTATGDFVRREVLRILEARWTVLDAHSRTQFAFSEIERQHMISILGTIKTLTEMAPVGPLAAARGNLSIEAALQH